MAPSAPPQPRVTPQRREVAQLLSECAAKLDESCAELHRRALALGHNDRTPEVARQWLQARCTTPGSAFCLEWMRELEYEGRLIEAAREECRSQWPDCRRVALELLDECEARPALPVCADAWGAWSSRHEGGSADHLRRVEALRLKACELGDRPACAAAVKSVVKHVDADESSGLAASETPLLHARRCVQDATACGSHDDRAFLTRVLDGCVAAAGEQCGALFERMPDRAREPEALELASRVCSNGHAFGCRKAWMLAWTSPDAPDNPAAEPFAEKGCELGEAWLCSRAAQHWYTESQKKLQTLPELQHSPEGRHARAYAARACPERASGSKNPECEKLEAFTKNGLGDSADP